MKVTLSADQVIAACREYIINHKLAPVPNTPDGKYPLEALGLYAELKGFQIDTDPPQKDPPTQPLPGTNMN